MPPAAHHANAEAVRYLRAALAQLVPCRHSADFASVLWYGQRYSFTALQGAIMRQLWEAWESETPELRAETLLEKAGADREIGRFAEVFRGHPAWGTMIVTGATKGSYQLAETPQEPNP